MKRLLVIGIILLFLFCNISFTTLSDVNSGNLSGKTLYVGGSGPGNYTKIQDAIDDASDGDAVFVYNGVYKENIKIYKSIRLIGENWLYTKIDGEYKGSTVNINESGVTVSGFTIENGYLWGMEVKSDNNIILKNNISCSMWLLGDIYGGIYVYKGDNNVISSNILYGDYIGWPIGLFTRMSANNTIINNVIKGNDEGIRLVDTSGNMVNNNTINNAKSVHNNGEAIYLENAVNNIIINNYGFDNFRVVYSSDNFIINNTGPRIIVENSLNITIQDNSGIIKIIGGYLEVWNTHTIEGNYCFGRPIYYYKNKHDVEVVPANAGQIILANCQNFTIHNLSMEEGSIQLGHCHHCEISGNYLNSIEYVYKPYGIELFRSSFINITNNKINSYGGGIYLLNSQNNTIVNNTINDSIGTGIFLNKYSSNNTIIGNIITNNYNGFISIVSNSNRISENVISSNEDYGIYLSSSHNIIDRNKISSNYYGIIIWVCNHCFNNSIFYNNINNNIYGINIIHYGLKNYDENKIYLNSISSNDCGVNLEDTKYVLFSSNNFIDNSCGVNLEGTNDVLFSSNNFIDNYRDVKFKDSDNIWEGNYWDHVWGTVKVLFGTKQIWEIEIIFTIPLIIPWLNFDLHPAKEPYDIQVPEV